MKQKKHEKINYIELPAKNIVLAKSFFSTIFAWKFTDYGADYAAFSAKDAGLDGGFYKSELTSQSKNGSVLVVFYSEDLKTAQSKIKCAGGKIIKTIFAFPGGHRFHFSDPNGNEYAIWSDNL